jgi:anti-sigma factor RsiW
MSACPDQEELLTLHAAGALEPADEARLRAHLDSCEACRREAESTTRLLGEMALPPPSAAMRERMETVPQRALGAWRREQVRKAFRARTVGAMLATAAAVLFVVNPVLRRQEAPRPEAPLAIPASSSETQADFELWAAADPLGDVLEPVSDEEDWEDGAETGEVEPSTTELFLELNSGETP